MTWPSTQGEDRQRARGAAWRRRGRGGAWRWALAAWVALAVAGAGVWTPRAAAIELEVRSETAFDLDLQAAGLRPRLRGRLVDNVNRGIDGARVLLTVAREGSGRLVVEREVFTDALGYFEVAPRLEAGAYVLRVRYAPEVGELYEAARVEAPLEVAREALALALEAPALVHHEAQARVVARVRRGGAASAMQVEGAPGAEGIAVEVRMGEAGWRRTVRLAPPTWEAEVSAPVEALGGRGHQAIEASFGGDEVFEPAQLKQHVFIYYKPRVTFSGEQVRERDQRGVLLEGAFESDDGPLEGARVRVEHRAWGQRGWREAGEVVTAAGGRFAAMVDEAGLAVGEVSFRVVLVPDEGAVFVSPPLTLEVEAGGLSRGAIWGLLRLLGLGVVGIGGRLMLERLLAWARRLRGRRAGRPEEARARPVALGEAPEGFSQSEHDIGGRVIDPLEGGPVVGAALTLVRDGEVVGEARSDDEGRFRMTALAPARYALRASARGYVTGEMAIEVPHDGTLRYFGFELISVRQRLRERYTWLLGGYAPDEALWGRATPAEVRDEVLALLEHAPSPSAPTRGAAAIARLRAALEGEGASQGALIEAVTGVLEEVYYSARAYDEGVLDWVEALVARLRGPLDALGQARQGAAGRGRARQGAASGAARWLGLALAAVAVSGGVGAAAAEDYGVESTAWNGLSELRAVAEEEGVELRARDTLDYSGLTPGARLLMLYPTRPLRVDSLEAFLSDGGRMLLADDFGASAPLLARFKIERRERREDPGAQRHMSGNPNLPIYQALGQHELLKDGVRVLVGNHPAELRSELLAVVYEDDGERGFIYDLTIGARGKLIVVGDASVFINLMMGVGDNRRFARNALRYLCGEQAPCVVDVLVGGVEGQGSYRHDDAQGSGVRGALQTGLRGLNELLDGLDQWVPERRLLRAMTMVLSIGLALFALTIFPMRPPRFLAIRFRPARHLQPRSEFERNLDSYRQAQRGVSFALPMAILRDEFERRFYAALYEPGERPQVGQRDTPPVIEESARRYAQAVARGADEAARCQQQASALLRQIARVPMRTQLFIEDQTRWSERALLDLHRQTQAALEALGEADEA